MGKKINNFIITGYGRSGTKFLSSIMNKSSIWQVEHEPRGNKDEKSTNKIHQREIISNSFNKKSYGEVNSYLRYYINDLNVDKKGLLLRNPLDIFLSVMNRRNNINHYKEYALDIKRWYTKFEQWSEHFDIIFFEWMTTDINYLFEVLHNFGIEDVELSNELLKKKINPNKYIKFKEFNNLPSKVQEYAKNHLFIDHFSFIRNSNNVTSSRSI
jgi:hypothetical protein